MSDIKKIKNPVFKKYYDIMQEIKEISQKNGETPLKEYTDKLKILYQDLQSVISEAPEFEPYRKLNKKLQPLQEEYRDKKKNTSEEIKEEIKKIHQQIQEFWKKNLPILFDAKFQNPQLTLVDKIKGVKGAFKRLREHGVFNKESYATEEEAIERTICCTTCTDATTCPYCGCGIKKKKLLATEDCPSKETYPHLPKFPPKNYWGVTKEKTSVIIATRNEKYLIETVENLLETATGDIEILVGFDGYPVDSEFLRKYIAYPRVKYHVEQTSIGRRAISNKLIKMATGKFIFEADAHIIMKEVGWDTKLKCVCDDNTIVGCVMDGINEEEWKPQGNRWLGCYIDKDFNWGWMEQKENPEWKKTEEVLSFHSAAWMVTKKTLEDIGSHKEFLGEYIDEEAEFTCDILCRGGKIIIRTDVECAHLFREGFPYVVKDDITISRRFLNNLWNNEKQNSYQTIVKIIDDFDEKYLNILHDRV